MSWRSWIMAAMALALAGCTSGYDEPYGRYPNPAYYDYGRPYYGGYYGYDAPVYAPYFYDYDDDDYDRYFHPAQDVTCDRARDVCYDRHGLSYHDTARYLGERDANRAYKHYGDEVFLFSPEAGTVCDRRTDACAGGHRMDRHDDDGRVKQRELRHRDALGAGNGPAGDDEQSRPRLRKKHSPSDLFEAQPDRPRPQRLAGEDDARRDRPSAKLHSDKSERRAVRPHSEHGGKPKGGDGGQCPPKGCANR